MRWEADELLSWEGQQRSSVGGSGRWVNHRLRRLGEEILGIWRGRISHRGHRERRGGEAVELISRKGKEGGSHRDHGGTEGEQLLMVN